MFRVHMVIGVLVLGVLFSQSLASGAEGPYEVKYVGGTVSTISQKQKGKLDVGGDSMLVFRWGKRSWEVPFKNITRMEYREKVSRWGKTTTTSIMGVPVFRKTKEEPLYLTLHVNDDAGKPQSAEFEIPRRSYARVIAVLQAKSGVKAEYDAGEAKQEQAKERAKEKETRQERPAVADEPSKEVPAPPKEASKPNSSARHLSLGTMKLSTLRKELDDAAKQGYRVVPGSPSQTEESWSFQPGREVSLTLEKVTEPPNTYEYLVLAANRTSTVQKELSEAAAKGFRVVRGTAILKETMLRGSETLVVLEKAPGSSTHYQYLVLSAMRSSTLEKEIAQARSQGYAVAGRVGGGELMAILEKAVAK